MKKKIVDDKSFSIHNMFKFRKLKPKAPLP